MSVLALPIFIVVAWIFGFLSTQSVWYADAVIAAFMALITLAVGEKTDREEIDESYGEAYPMFETKRFNDAMRRQNEGISENCGLMRTGSCRRRFGF